MFTDVFFGRMLTRLPPVDAGGRGSTNTPWLSVIPWNVGIIVTDKKYTTNSHKQKREDGRNNGRRCWLFFDGIFRLSSRTGCQSSMKYQSSSS